jgi:predicted enzyme related to lactoylglutathione lyase
VKGGLDTTKAALLVLRGADADGQQHVPAVTSGQRESTFAAVRLRTTAANRVKVVEHATALTWTTLLVVEQHFRKLNAPHLCTLVCEGVAFHDGIHTITPADAAPTGQGGQTAMKIHYLEIVTKSVDAVCAAYAASNGVQFGEPDAGLGNARTAPMPGGGLVGVRAPLRETEAPVVRPYWLVDDIEAAVAAAVKAGGSIAVPPMKLPGHGTCAIYLQGGIDHGFWQK